jgi:phosphohistidine phosphatase
MKTLVLIRHAMANNKQVSQHDSMRTLNELGELQAKNIAEQLKKRNYLPDYLLCSPAKRTLQTATILLHTLKLNPALIEIDNTLYSGDPEEILSSLCILTKPKQLFVIGHNPILSELAHRLCSFTKTIILPPAGAIAIELPINSWDELIKTQQGRLLFFIEPDHGPH